MFDLYTNVHLLRIALAVALLGLAGCGSGSRPMNSGNFSGTAAPQGDVAAGTLASRAGVAKVTLSPSHITGGDSTEITVNLAQPAPDGGLAVQLKSSDVNAVVIPSTVTIPSGQTSATVTASTSPAEAATKVAITALYGDSVAGTSLDIDATAKAAFTVALQPTTLTIKAAHSGTTKVVTTAKNGYNHALQLTVLNVPAGVTVTFAPPVIPAPGTGTSKAKITVSKTAALGTYSVRVKASDGKTSHTATLMLTVTSSSGGPGATFQGCWYQQNGHKYQGSRISVTNPGTYAFDAVLYYGATCSPSNFADEFGFGTLLNFGGFGYIFWFSDFADQTDTSATWSVGSDKSQCVSYATAPDC